MKFTLGERTTPARRVYDVIADAGQASPYEVYRQTQLVASTRDAQWYCRELGRVGVAKPVGSGWQLIQPTPTDLDARLRDLHGLTLRVYGSRNEYQEDDLDAGDSLSS